MVDVESQRVLVNSLNHGQLGLALDVDVQNSVDTVVTDDSVEIQSVNEDVLRSIQVSAVDDNRDVASNAGTASGTLAELGAVTSINLDDVGLCHENGLLNDSILSRRVEHVPHPCHRGRKSWAASVASITATTYCGRPRRDLPEKL